jgi:hypothetical protein
MNAARVVYFTDKFDETLAWWRDGVGLELLEHWDRDTGRGAILAMAPGIVVEFMAAPRGTEPWSPPARDAFSLAIPTSDPKKRMAELRDNGLKIDKPMMDRPWAEQFSTRDPNDVEVYFSRFK